MQPALSFREVPPCRQRSVSSQLHDRAVPPLPNEIWAEIHAHLPPDTVAKMIGVNHYFFDAAMNEIYKVVSVTSVDDVEQNRRLQELQNPGTALRVRHIQLSPDFLPFCNRDGIPLPQPTHPENATLLKKTMKVLYNCKKLENLTIQLHFSHAATKPFQDFLNSLSLKVGRRLRKLTIKICVIHFRVLAAISSSRSLFPNIETVDLTILPSHFVNQSKQVQYGSPPSEALESFRNHILGFSASVRHSIKDFHVTNYEPFGISLLFKGPGEFTSLKELRYQGYGMAHTLSSLQGFEQLVRTATNLHYLSFRALASPLWPSGPPINDFEHTSRNPDFTKHILGFELRALCNLHIQLPEYLPGPELDKLTLILATFCPNLKRLVVESSEPLKYVRFRRILDAIVKFSRDQDRGRGLNHLSFRRLDLFSAAHLDEILRNFFQLEVLAIEFEHLSADPEHRKRNPTQSRTDFKAKLLTTFRDRRYSSPRLEKLYLTRRRGVPAELLESLATALPNVRFFRGPPP